MSELNTLKSGNKTSQEDGTVFLLIESEYFGQCTGAGRFDKVLGVFLGRPSIPELAPFIGKHLSENMGEAIQQVQTLHEKGVFDSSDSWSVVLIEAPLNVKLIEELNSEW